MPSYATTRHVRHTASDMFALVADVERYPEFLPLCEKLVVRTRTRDVDREVLVATMTVAYGFLRESFTSRVTLEPERMMIRAEYLDGPFRRLDNVWGFEPMDEDECLVRFSIDYEFRSRALGLVVGSIFDRAFRRFAEAFEQRADAVYGREAAAAASTA